MSKVGRCFIFLWVDDLLIFGAKDQMQPLVDKILATFEGRDLKELSYVLGMEVIRDRSKKTITITHRTMITELLSRFNMSDCKRSPTPLVPKEKIMSLSRDPSLERATVSEHKRFMQAVGSIQTSLRAGALWPMPAWFWRDVRFFYYYFLHSQNICASCIYTGDMTSSIQANTLIETPKIRIPTYRWWISEHIPTA